MGCLSSKEKYNVNKEERGLKHHRLSNSHQRFSENGGYKEVQRRHSSQQNFTVTLDGEIVKKMESSVGKTSRNQALVNENITANSSDQNCKTDSGGFSSRNQFDRASQLRRSKKKRRKSDDNILSPGKENSSTPAPNTASEIVKQETKALNLNLTSQSIGSRAEYNSSYGNLI